MKLLLIFVINCIVLINIANGNTLEVVSDDDLIHTIKTNDFVVVLFAKKDCDTCDQYETQILNLLTDLKESLNAIAIKASNSQLTRLYNPKLEPALVFFRHGVPLLYDGPIHEDAIYQKFDENRVPSVKELSDDNFEHLTQAATGATTGDWFVLFYAQDCIECQRLTAVWEAVGAGLKNRANVARINKDSVGRHTAKRFKIRKSPEYIFVRQGKFYRYEIPKYDVASFVSFAQEFYRNARSEKVPPMSSPFDDLVERVVGVLKSYERNGLYNPLFILIAAVAVTLGAIAICIVKRSPKKPATDKKKAK